MNKIPQTDAIFENVFAKNQASDANPRSLRLSIDTKAKLKIGNLSRGGKDRTLEARQANDHDTEWETVLVPFGILNTHTDQLSIYFGESAETSDFIVDCLAAWWQEHQHQYPELEELVINLDGGSATRSNRTQFIKRIVQWSQAIGLSIQLVYYPPYHSKYNPIERCWAVLEHYWQGAILDSVDAALEWASHMTWKGIEPLVHFVDTTYQKSVKVMAEELKQYRPFWLCSPFLPKWDVTVVPN